MKVFLLRTILFCLTLISAGWVSDLQSAPGRKEFIPTGDVPTARQSIRSSLTTILKTCPNGSSAIDPAAEFRALPVEVRNRYHLMLVEIKENSVAHTFNGRKDIMRGRGKQVLGLLRGTVEQFFIPDLALIFCLGDRAELPTDTLESPVFFFNIRKPSPNFAPNALLFPDPYLINYLSDATLADVEKAKTKYPWEQKKETILFRGASTGGVINLRTVHYLPRCQLVRLSSLEPQVLDASFTKYVQFMAGESGEKAKAALLALHPLAPRLSPEDHQGWKYILCPDGNASAWGRPLWIMKSNSVLVYQTSFVQWMNFAMLPHVHYVPMEKGSEAVFTVYHWLKSHDDQVRGIVRAANALMKECFSKEAIMDDLAFYLNGYAELFQHQGEN